jgi:hypothetical protein
MADIVLVDLASVKAVLNDGSGLGLHSLQGCVPEIGISTEHLAALLAGDLSAIDGVIRPSEFCSTDLAVE